MALKEKSNQQQENKKAFRSCNTDSSSSANSQVKFQSSPADNNYILVKKLRFVKVIVRNQNS